ncbi:MAG: S41 family peptidase [Cyclobacteriaceae bacterium]|nr:S41 family peptidase [Cyclobacteriaceae bacterium]
MKHLKISGLLIALALVVWAFAGPGEKYFEIAKSLDIFSTLFKEVNAYYVDEVDPKKLIETGIEGMLTQLDPYTDYISEEEQESFSILTTGQYAGVGALIGIVNKKTVITNPYTGFPAAQAGLRVGDEIISVDGKNVQGKPTIEVSSLMKGKPKTEVVIEVKRAGTSETLKFKLIREKIKIANVSYYGLVTPDVAYIKLDEFTPGAGKEVEEALTSLKKKGAKKLILDLRENLGGSLYEAVNIANLFLPKGKEVVSTKGKVEEWNKTYTTLNQPVDTQIPLTILTSASTASASEIVAGALQDYDRAVLIGQKTFGKGLVQTTRQLAYNAQLKVTTAKYYIPSGRCIQAIDYEHRKADGSVARFPDSLKREFKTHGGRKVFDGAGLDPDIKVEPPAYSPAVAELVSSGLVFEYASLYCAGHPLPESFRNFKLSELEADRFVNWVAQQKFTYTSELDQRATELIAAARKEKTYDDLQIPLRDLKNKIEQNKADVLKRNKEDVIRILEEEIAFHYQTDKGQAEVRLSRDAEIHQALKTLADTQAYRNMLTAN